MDVSIIYRDQSSAADRATVRQIARSKRDAVQGPAVVHAWHAARLVWQHRLDGSPSSESS